jgi:hypothetical protein
MHLSLGLVSWSRALNGFEVAAACCYSFGVADLTGVRAKFERARWHAQEFDVGAQTIINNRPFELVAGVESDGWCHIRWKQNGEAPDTTPLALIFSDMLYNLRAALDYIAWQLVLANGGQPGRHTSFPCVSDQAKWNDAVDKPLKDIDNRWVAEIAKLQPFDASYTGAPEHHPFAILDAANNLCKHRLLPATLMSTASANHKIDGLTPGVKMDRFFNDVPIADGVDHFKFILDRPTSIVLTVDSNPRYRIKFADVPDFDWKNWDLVNWVEAAISIFTPAFS